MKRSLDALTMVGVICGGLLTHNAAGDMRPGGPKGGRILENTEPVAEFHMADDHTASVTFYDAALKPVPASGQSVTVIATAQGGKQTIEFETRDDVLVSKSKLPEGDGYDLVLQIRRTAETKPQIFRFKLLMHICDGCKRHEYACICDE